jgi:hypothetical protein
MEQGIKWLMDHRYKIEIKDHAQKRLQKRGIHPRQIFLTVRYGKVIEPYPDRDPPGCLLLHWIDGEPLHVAINIDDTAQIYRVRTVYKPDPRKWTHDFERRQRWTP